MFWYMVWNILITFYNLINCSKSILQFNQKIYKYICDQQTLEIYQNAPIWIQTFKNFLGCHPFWKRAHGLVSCLAFGIEKVHNLTISRNQNQPRTWQFKRILSWKIYIVSLCLFNSWDDMKIPSQNPCELVSEFTRCHEFAYKSSKFSRDDTPEPPSMAQPPASRCPYEVHFILAPMPPHTNLVNASISAYMAYIKLLVL